MKKCSICKLFKILDCFHNCSRASDGKGKECKDCCKIRSKKRYLKRAGLEKSIQDMTVEERILQFVKIPEDKKECWIYRGELRNGYGRICLYGKKYTVHRLMYIIKYGKIKKKLKVLHECDNPSCCNPNHLLLGTQDDNVQDMISKRRDNKASGQDNGQSKLRNIDVIEIKQLLKTNKTMAEISRIFKVSEACIKAIKDERTWSHIKITS